MERHAAGEQGRSTLWYELMMQHSVVSEEFTGALNALNAGALNALNALGALSAPKGSRFRMGNRQRRSSEACAGQPRT